MPATPPPRSGAPAARRHGNNIINVLRDLGQSLDAVQRSLQPRHLGHAGPHLSTARPTTGAFRCEVDWDLGGATLTSITAYRDYESGQPGDIDYSTVDILYRADDDNVVREFQTFTQELRLQGSAFDGVLDWLVGGYFADEDLHVRDNLTLRQPIWRVRDLPPRFAAVGLAGAATRRPRRAASSAGAAAPAVLGAFGAAGPISRRLRPAGPINDRGSTLDDLLARTAATARSSRTTSSTSPTSSI